MILNAGSTAPPDALYTLSISFYNRHTDKWRHVKVGSELHETMCRWELEFYRSVRVTAHIDNKG